MSPHVTLLIARGSYMAASTATAACRAPVPAHEDRYCTHATMAVQGFPSDQAKDSHTPRNVLAAPLFMVLGEDGCKRSLIHWLIMSD
jgi:hypothetical protein